MEIAHILMTMFVGLVVIPTQAANSRQIFTGHVPAVVAKLQPIGRLPATNELRLAIGLASRDEQGLDRFIQQLYDPANPNYRHYLTPAQFAEKFGPTEQDYKKLIDCLESNGLSVAHQYSNRVVLDVKGTVANIEKTFQVTLRTYPHPDEARTFYAPDAEPSLALGVSVSHIAGLDNYMLPHPKHKQHLLNRSDNGTTKAGSPKEGSAPNGNLWGNDFRDAYVPGTTLTGIGQNIGLLEFEGFYVKDITNYENVIGLSVTSRPQLVIVPLNGGATPQDGGDNGEECSGDIQMAVSMAPGLNAIYVFENGGAINNAQFDDIFESMVTYTNVFQFSCSWGGGTASNATSEVLFKQMAAQGQSFYDASGDSGAFVGNVEFPSDSPSIMQVGGTTMTDGNSPSYPWQSEIVWNWGTNANGNFNGNGYGASSGGISTYYAIPGWQTNINMTANLGSTTMRNFPDVAANADNCYLYTDDGEKSGGWGGTSYASPLWAGFTALINQQAVAYGRPPVGFLNPALYSLASGTNHTNFFHDITSGNDTWKNSPSKFYAATGFDLCTGLGTMNGTNLINALAPMPTPSFLPPIHGSGGLTLTWSSVTGLVYQVQFNTNLLKTNWINFGSAITATGSVEAVSDSFTNSQRFYRVVLQP
jgi:subtilase family serine protease